jgi:hypothetical protein
MVTASPAVAQRPRVPSTGQSEDRPPFKALTSRIKPGDEISVTERQGRESSGHLTTLSPATMTLLVNGVDRDIPLDEIGRVERADSLWDGALVGGLIFSLGGLGAGASCSPHCVAAVTGAMLGFGATGAFLGALADRRANHPRPIYGPAPASKSAFRPGPPVSALGDLWKRARGGDAVRVIDASGQATRGTIAEMSTSSLAVLVDHRRREIPASEIREIKRRGDRRWMGALVGLAIGVTRATLPTGNNECRQHPDCTIAATFWGYAIGAAIPRYVAVYQP